MMCARAYVISCHVVLLLVLTGGQANRTQTYTYGQEADDSIDPKFQLVIDGEFVESDNDCRVYTVDPFLYDEVRLMVENKVKLMEYTLEFPGYEVNPLMVNNTLNHRPKTWARVTQQHGQTLLALAFNYGVLSLMTLTFGVERMPVELRDEPGGCVRHLRESEKIGAVMRLLMRDYTNSSEITLVAQERICHEVIMVDEDGYARFKDRCCSKNRVTRRPECTTDIINIWLIILRIMLALVRYGIIFFGPTWFIHTVELLKKEEPPYKVKLKEPLKKTIVLAKSDTHVTLDYGHKLDFRYEKKFPRFRESLQNIPLGVPTKVKITEYDIEVSYKKLLTENNVPVGLWTLISRNLLLCKIRDVGPFVQCCVRNMFIMCPNRKRRSWISCCSKLGLILMILLVPFPFYIRLFVFYHFERAEVYSRKEAIAKIGAREAYENSLIHYLTPTHGLFIFMYVIYFVTAVLLAYMARTSEEGKFKQIIVGSFMDLKHLKWINVLSLFVSNMIWPFSRYGGAGFFVGLLYWPIALPINLVIFACYCLPSIYLTLRMLFYSKTGILDKMKSRGGSGKGYRRLNRYDESIHLFETSRLLGDATIEHGPLQVASYGNSDREMSPSSVGDPDGSYADDEIEEAGDAEEDIELGMVEEGERGSTKDGGEKPQSASRVVTQGWREYIEHIGASLLCVVTMFSVLLILSECVGSLVEMLVFTTMGIIVNAGQVLKYVTLLLLVLLYSYDCFNNVGKKYLKLNKALFSEIKGRIKDLADITRLPSHLQENTGFKSEQLSEQAEGEVPDEVRVKRRRRKKWLINDLVLFVDNEDMPRIPTGLFERVCEIRVAGAPGPIYQSHIDAFKQFLVILCFLMFVFIVVLSFGAVYKVSSTNQMMATMAGGFMPFILKTFMQPSRPDIEIGSVSFKSKLDEIIRRFSQKWPIHDFPFELWTEEDEEEEKNGQEEESRSQDDVTATVGTQTDGDHPGRHLELVEPPSYDKAASFSNSEKSGESTSGTSSSDESELTKVDYLVYVPEMCDANWLKEWSDLDEIKSDNETSPAPTDVLKNISGDANANKFQPQNHA